jgi:predicted GNAT family N-acyltransferase
MRQQPQVDEGFREARLKDQDAIYEMLISEAQNGHFNEDYLNDPRVRKGLKIQIQLTINFKKMPVSETQSIDSSIYVYNKNGRLVAFSWIKEADQVELYQLVVAAEERKQGLGTIMVEKSMDLFPKGTRFYARLFAASKQMKSILIKLGFHETPSKARETITLSFP